MILFLFYHPGETTVGRRQSELCTDHDIQLNGVLVAENHWYALMLFTQLTLRRTV
jgi:hypothetical protein